LLLVKHDKALLRFAASSLQGRHAGPSMNKRCTSLVQERPSSHSDFSRKHLLRRAANANQEQMEDAQANDTEKHQGGWNANQAQRKQEQWIPPEIGKRSDAGVINAHTNGHGKAQASRGKQESGEEDIVPLADAIINEGAMMVEHQHTVVAVCTVRGPWRSNDLAG